MNETTMKSFVTISEICSLLNISRTRFYILLQKGVFPPPKKTHYCSRKYYDLEGQKTCLRIKETGETVDGKPVFFYQKKDKSVSNKEGSKPKSSKYDVFVDSLTALGVSSVDHGQVEKTIKRLYPSGIAQIDESEVIRTLFIDFSSQNG